MTNTESKIAVARSNRFCAKCENIMTSGDEYFIFRKNNHSSYKIDYCMNCIRTPDEKIKEAQDVYVERYGMKG